MSTQQDIYAAGLENRPPMLNKDNYVPWLSRIIRYAKSRPNGNMIFDSIENGVYVRRMIATPGELDLPVPVPGSFHEQTDEELTENDIKRMDADDQAIQTILLGLPKDVYAVVDSCETAKEIWERVRQMMKRSDIGEQEKKAKFFNEWEKFTSTDGESIESYYHRFMQLMNDLKKNNHFPENIAANLKFLNNLQPEWKRHVTIVRQTKNLHEADFTQIYDFLKMNQDEYAGQVAQNQQGYNTWQNGRIQGAQNAIQNAGVQNGGNQNGLVVVPGIANQNGTEDCARNCTARPRRRDAAYLQTQLLIAQKEEAGIQLQAKEFDFMAAACDLDEIEEANANCILMANLQHASTSEQYTHLLEPIPEPQLVPQNDNHVTFVAPSMVQSGGTVETSSAPNEETRAHQETVYRNLVDQIAQVNMVNCFTRATNAELKSEGLFGSPYVFGGIGMCLRNWNVKELESDSISIRILKIPRTKQDLSLLDIKFKNNKINDLHLSSAKQITTLNNEISNLNKLLSKEKSSISSLVEEKKRLKPDFKTREDKFLDKEVDLEAKIKDLENILLKRDQTVQIMHMLN
nr:hypothetical protein [Tanacetum cinerariifolium]